MTMTSFQGPYRLHGRAAETAAVDGLLGRTRAGGGGALLLTGPPGSGRTALVTHAVRAFRHGGAARPAGGGPGTVLAVRAVAAERDLPHSGVHALLCRAAGRLSVRARDVLRAGLAPGDFLELLNKLAAAGPLLVCVDDAHHWDEASRAALGFAARRLGPAHPVAVLLTTETPGAPGRPGASGAGTPEFAGLPALRLGPLGAQASAALLDDVLPGGARPAVREELLADAGGNPKLLTELAAARGPGPAGDGGPPAAPGPAGSLLARYAAEAGALPADTRLLLLLAAADHVLRGGGGSGGRLLAAARSTGLDAGRLEPAERAGLVRTDGGRVRFDPPVLARIVHDAAPLAARRAAHAVLADVLDGAPHRLLRLRHRAAAATGPDAACAAALADAAHAGRDHREAAAALAEAAAISADDDARVARLAAAAERAWQAGHPHTARDLLARARTLPADEAVRGRAELVRGELELRDGPSDDAHAALLLAAGLLAPTDREHAVAALLGAADAAWATGDVPAYLAALDRAARLGPLPALLGDYGAGMHALMSGRFTEARPLLHRALARAAGEEDPVRLLRAGGAALVLGDVPAARSVGARALAAARARGLDTVVPQALEYLAYGELRAGQYARARAHARAGLAAAGQAGQRNTAAQLHGVLAMAASVLGPVEECAAHAKAAAAIAGPHGLDLPATLATWAVARADLACGRPREAAARLGPLVRPGPRRGHLAVRMMAAPCFVEASAQTGAEAEAVAVLEEFTGWAAWTTDPQATAQLARCRAVLTDAEAADELYERALVCHDRAAGDFERARTQLLYGKALRRRRRPLEAREHLWDALVGFERCGAAAWQEQARAELRATGDAVRAAVPGPLSALTPQQSRIARYVAEGATNREIAERLSVSPRTVDYHLRNVFAALGVRSRVELARVVDRAGEWPQEHVGGG
ncbi:AAA family ATPase [Streptomyces sp. TRM 70351]|uniref:helix-turn-helix transcriptional regulator n=1 Tax=Streptomyces sp. TRM 70351 TaxID=3116552 RepID=UPI002E7BA981|nr:AAA family ATPase [Streptomyces sp. TRM 70351]MEE1927884.1 AAA family ATPase [Streptomyces sp. TRM 70351]